MFRLIVVVSDRERLRSQMDVEDYKRLMCLLPAPVRRITPPAEMHYFLGKIPISFRFAKSNTANRGMPLPVKGIVFI
jgi:hypothetical protein